MNETCFFKGQRRVDQMASWGEKTLLRVGICFRTREIDVNGTVTYNLNENWYHIFAAKLAFVLVFEVRSNNNTSRLLLGTVATNATCFSALCLHRDRAGGGAHPRHPVQRQDTNPTGEPAGQGEVAGGRGEEGGRRQGGGGGDTCGRPRSGRNETQGVTTRRGGGMRPHLQIILQFFSFVIP